LSLAEDVAPGGGSDPLFPHQLRTGSEGGPGQDPLHPGRLPPDRTGRGTGRFPEHDPGLALQGIGDPCLLRASSIKELLTLWLS
jgi:hypothetical protein